jgi:hypothetical protein
VAAFYGLRSQPIYRRGRLYGDRVNIVFRGLPVRFEVKQVVYGMPEILLAAEITLGRLYRRVPQQELNLLQRSSAVMTQLRTGPPQVMGCDMLQARSPAAGPDHVHTTFCEMPAPHTFPVLATPRKILPSVTLAASIH